MSNSKNPIIAPSILGADFSNLQKEVEFCNDSKAEWLHLDIMDQLFVPNLSFGPGLVKSLRSHSELFFDVIFQYDFYFYCNKLLLRQELNLILSQ